jgi:signal transduction histidine kinase
MAFVADEQRTSDVSANLSSEQLFDAVPYWITIHDRDFRVVSSSAKLIHEFGNHLGEKCYSAYKNRTEPCPDCALKRTFEDGEEHTSREALFDARGMPRHVLAKTAPVRNQAGEIAAVMKVYMDVTEIRALQNELAGLGQLIGEIAHDAKNILDGLQGGVYIVNLGFGNGNQEDIRVGWGMIQRNVKRLSAMLTDMLYCARRRTPGRMPVSLASVLHEAVELFAPRARQFRVDLQLRGAEDAEILGEPEQILKMVSNLIGNAIDACTDDVEEQAPRHILVALSRDELDAIIEVEDNGIGMDGATRDVLFKNATTTKGSAGSGLGLLLAQKVASEHGGAITVRSELGKGSVFTVRLPARHPKSVLT